MEVKYEIVATDREVTLDQFPGGPEKVKPVITLQCREIPENRMQIIVREGAYVTLITHVHNLKEDPKYVMTPFISQHIFVALRQLPDLEGR